MEQLEARCLLAADWQNPLRTLDVNNDRIASPLDVLLIVNRLNDRGSGSLGNRTNPLDYYYDTSGDGLVSPLDVLLVVNALNQYGDESPYAVVRKDGESAGAPAGFISIPLLQLPGTSSDVVQLSTSRTSGANEFQEFGFFVVDTAQGHVEGIAPDSPDYPRTVFERIGRHSLYSDFDLLRTAQSSLLPGGRHVRAYVMQQASAIGDAAAHLRSWRDQDTLHVGWQEHVGNWPAPPEDGGPAYDDIQVEIHIGQPQPGNSRPLLASIPDRNLDELTPLDLTVRASDYNHPRSQIALELIKGPAGMTLDAATGRLQWTPRESDGPGQAEVIVRAVDPLGATDAERFLINLLEVNTAPTLQPHGNMWLAPGDTISFFARASDADLPANDLRFSLGAGTPDNTLFDPVSGLFSWTAPLDATNQDYTFHLRVSDGGSPALNSTQSFTVSVDDCPLVDLQAWRVAQSGGSPEQAGGVTAQNCTATINEGDSFQVTMETSFVIPDSPSELRFSYEQLDFDLSRQDSIRDAFEVALLDRLGNSLVRPFVDGRDAFFNIGEQAAAAFSPQAVQALDSVTLDISNLLPGEFAKLVFRLTNNDQDTGTSLRITDVRLPTPHQPPPADDNVDPTQPIEHAIGRRCAVGSHPTLRPSHAGPRPTRRPGRR